MNDPYIYKILTLNQWTTLRTDGQTSGSPLDRQDGYIHFSTHAQLRGTLDIHYVESGDLILARVLLDRLPAEAIKWEAARDGSLFPHLYADLLLASVTQHWTLHPGIEGRYALPDLSR